MKRAMALLEQQKSRSGFSKDDSMSIKPLPAKQSRLPSGSRISIETEKMRILQETGQNTLLSKSRVDSRGTGSKVEILRVNEAVKPYQLSLQQKNKKPHKLKPLQHSQITGASYDKEFVMPISKQQIKEIDQEMKDYMDVNKVLSQMETAFTGEVSTTSYSQTDTDTYSNSSLKKAHSFKEQQVALYSQNSTEGRLKKNQNLKNKVKQLTGTQIQSEVDTFITSCAVKKVEAEEEKTFQGRSEQKKFYRYQEDELLDELDQHEKDMNDMLKYLTEVEEMVKGSDLKHIQSLIEVTQEGMNQHFQAYDSLKTQITQLNAKAEESINKLQGDTKIELKPKRYELDRIKEKEGSQTTSGPDKPSQEAQKQSIVNQLVGIADEMREFSMDLEFRLDRAHKGSNSIQIIKGSK